MIKFGKNVYWKSGEIVSKYEANWNQEQNNLTFKLDSELKNDIINFIKCWLNTMRERWNLSLLVLLVIA